MGGFEGGHLGHWRSLLRPKIDFRPEYITSKTFPTSTLILTRQNSLNLCGSPTLAAQNRQHGSGFNEKLARNEYQDTAIESAHISVDLDSNIVIKKGKL